jgi:CRISPR-associated protein/minimal CRISPR polymerase domain
MSEPKADAGQDRPMSDAVVVTGDSTLAPPRVLLGVSLPGVQRFIAASRKTADLWGASEIRQELAYLVHTIISTTSANTEFVIPSGQVSASSMTNRLVAVVDQEQVAELQNRIEVAVSDRWAEMVEQAYKTAKGSGGLPSPHLPVVSAAVEYRPDDHKKCWRQLQQALTAKRRVRSFPAISQSGSSLCGQCAELQVSPTKTLPNRSGTEELCVSCITKRVRGSDSKFPSTSTISAAPFLARFAERSASSDDVASHIVEIQRLHKSLELPTVADSGYQDPSLIRSATTNRALDGSWWFPSSWEPEKLKADNSLLTDRPNADLEEVCKASRATLSQLFELLDGDQPHGSYAIVAMDGDRVGVHLSTQNSLQEVQKVAQALTKFASSAKGLVEASLGRVVYSGGDDLLVLVPVEHALDLVQALEVEFRSNLPGLTMSAAVHVVPRSAPLMAALATVRQTLEWAKSLRPSTGLEGRLGISVDVRSGIRGRLAIAPSSATSFDAIRAAIAHGSVSRKLPGSLERQAQLFDTDVRIGSANITRPQRTWLSVDCLDQLALLSVTRQTTTKTVAHELFNTIRTVVDTGASFGPDMSSPTRQRLGCFAAVVDIAVLLTQGESL